jgi:hypothetical protein
VVKFDQLDTALAPSTPRVTPAERQAALSARRAGIRRRFPR